MADRSEHHNCIMLELVSGKTGMVAIRGFFGTLEQAKESACEFLHHNYFSATYTKAHVVIEDGIIKDWWRE